MIRNEIRTSTRFCTCTIVWMVSNAIEIFMAR
jgi:hypothetical protein